MLLTYKENVHSTQMYIPLNPLFSRHKGIGVQFTDEPTGALDSKSSKDLLESLKLLNETEHTAILMVTHDAYTASYARRVIFIKDGKVFHELLKGTEERRSFFEQIMDVISLLGGDMNYAD